MPFVQPLTSSVQATGRAVAAHIGFGALAVLPGINIKDMSIKSGADWHTGHDEQNRISYDIVSAHDLSVTLKGEVMSYGTATWPSLTIGTIFDSASFPVLQPDQTRGHPFNSGTTCLLKNNPADSIKPARPHDVSLEVVIRNYPLPPGA